MKDFGLAALWSITLESVELYLQSCVARVDAPSLANMERDKAIQSLKRQLNDREKRSRVFAAHTTQLALR